MAWEKGHQLPVTPTGQYRGWGWSARCWGGVLEWEGQQAEKICYWKGGVRLCKSWTIFIRLDLIPALHKEGGVGKRL